MMQLSAILSLALAAPCMAQWWWPPTGGMVVSPETCITPGVQMSVWVGGQWPDSCKPNYISAIVTGSDIDIQTVTDPPPVGCLTVITNWGLSASLTAPEPGAYNVYVTHRAAGQTVHPRTLIGSIAVDATCCYPNCDHSTAPPILNALDFSCFLSKFAAGDRYANCDGSWNPPPILNALDFGCFLTKFAAGCS